MKCQICGKGEGEILQFDKDIGEIKICKKCKEEFYTPLTEDKEFREEQRAERRAELNAGI